MAAYNRITPEIAAQLRDVAGDKRFYQGAEVDPNYGHDEMPIYGRHIPDAAVGGKIMAVITVPVLRPRLSAVCGPAAGK